MRRRPVRGLGLVLPVAAAPGQPEPVSPVASGDEPPD